jgi:hypothetical protein
MTAPAEVTTDALAQLVYQLATNPMFAFQFAQDGHGVVAAQGVDFDGADVPAAVAQACAMPGFPPDAAEALQSYTSGGGGGGGGAYPQPAPHPQPVEHVVQQLQYVNYVTHEGDTTIQQTILDQSTNVSVGDNFTGTLDVDADPVAATGDGAVAGGENSDINAATGENSQAIDESTIGNNANNSAGAVQAGEDINAPVNTGFNSGVIAEDIDAPVVQGTNTGVVNDGDINAPVLANSSNSGVIADGDVDDTVIGNNNQGNNNDIGSDANVVFGFGEGETTNVNDSILDNSAVGDENAVGNSLGQGAVVETGDGNATSNFQDNDQDNDTTTTTTENNSVSTGDNSIVTTEQGPGDNDSFDNSFQDNDNIDADLNLPRTLEVERTEAAGPDADDDGGAAA